MSRLRRALALTLTFLLAFGTTAGALVYNRLQGNIDRHDLGDLLGTDRPADPAPTQSPDTADPNAGQTLNLLFLGSDSRDGENADVGGYGEFEGMRADTTLLVQIPADRSSLTVVSIPRDTLVDIPSCTRPDGTTSAPQSQAMFNSAFSTGSANTSLPHGAACTIRTVEALTGVLIDDFVVVDFAGFIGLIDALDGVPMDVEEPISDVDAGLELTAGCQILHGHDALGYARVRKTVGDGSDISRIGRQQELLMAIIRDVLSSRVLTDPVRLYQVADAATQTITTGQLIGSLPQIVGLAASMKDVNLDEIAFITMPFDWAGARVVPNARYSAMVWEALRQGQPVDPRLTGAGWEISEQIAADEAAAAEAAANEAATDAEQDGSTETPDAGEPTPETPTTDDTQVTIPPSDAPVEAPSCTRETASG